MGSYTWRIQILTAFLAVYFRYFLLGLSRIAGGLIRFLATGWRPVFLWLIISAEIVVIWEIINSVISETAFTIAGILTTETLALAIVLFAIGFLVFAGWKARHNVVLADFVDHTSTQADAKKPGLSSILVIELRRLRELYQEVDERRPISSLGGRKSLLDYAISVDDTGDLLKQALASETTVKLGPFSVPVGVIAGVAGRIVQGPRISGGFHKDGDLYSLTAQMYGKTAKSWKVEGKLAPKDYPVDETNPSILHWPDGKVLLYSEKENEVKTIDPMIRELACRIFTDCTSGGSTRWRATHAFNEGIREYRRTIYSSKDWLLNLRNAERRFLEAISEDNYFDLAYYNLGVVYTELFNQKMNREPAQKAFLSAVKHNPERWQSYFSLALNRFAVGTDSMSYDQSLIEDVMHHCNQAIALNRRNAKIHDLLGVCHRILATQGQLPENEDHLVKSAKNHVIAVRNAWKTICAEEFDIGKESQGQIDDSRKTSWITLWDLAQDLSLPARCERKGTVHDMVPSFWQDFSLTTAEKILLQARYLNKSNALVERELGDIAFKRGKYESARKSFEAACRIEPSNLQNWFLLAVSCIKTQGRNLDQREMALQKVLENPSEWYTRLPPRWKMKVRETLPLEGTSGRLREILDFFEKEEELEEKFKKKDLKIDNLIAQYESYKSAGRRREQIAIAHEVALKLEADNLDSSLQYFDYAIRACNENETWEKGIISKDRADCFRKKGDNKNANASYEDSIKYLKNGHYGEIIKNAIFLNYVRSLLQEGNRSKALDVANSAYSKNPIGFNQLAALGECWLANQDYMKAQSAFESAMLLRPGDSNMPIQIGYCYWKMGGYSKEIEEKEKYWQKALTSLETILPLIDETDVTTKLYLSRLIGKCYMDYADFTKAVYHLEIARAMSYDPFDLIVIYLDLASAYLSKRDHDSSEYWFSRTIEVIQNMAAEEGGRIQQDRRSRNLPSEGEGKDLSPEEEGTARILLENFVSFNEGFYVGYFFIRALLGEAYSMAERDAGLDQENLEPMNLVTQAEDMYSLITSIDAAKKDRYLEAEIDDRKGWIYYKLEKLDDAEKYVKQAISLRADPEFHLHLAYVYSSKIGEMKDTEMKNVTTRKASVHCIHARDMATNKVLKERAEGLLEVIQGKPSSPGS